MHLDSGANRNVRRLAQVDGLLDVEHDNSLDVGHGNSLVLNSMNPSQHVPEEVDWVVAGVVTPVRDQGLTCGELHTAMYGSHPFSCIAFLPLLL